MAELFLARQRGIAGFDRWVVIKRLLPDLAADPRAVRQFLDEARMAAMLAHPRIITIYEVGEEEGQYFIAMEYVRGATLADVLADAALRGISIPIGIALGIIRDAAEGLDFAHGAEDADGNHLAIVHRDVSPSNLIVDERGSTRILDFGIARSTNRLTKTEAGTVKGKMGYMPLEQLSGETVDARADQYALGVVLWELCSGRSLFPSDNMVKLVSERTVPRLSSIRSDVPPTVDAIVQRMLAPEAADRFASCAEVVANVEAVGTANAADVQRFTQQLVRQNVDRQLGDAVSVPNPGGGTAVLDATKSDAPKPSPRRWALWVAAVLALGLVGAVFFGSARLASERQPAPVSLVETATATQHEAAPPKRAAPPTVETPEQPPKPRRRRVVTRKQAKSANTFGWLNIDTQPWSEVWIDKKFVGTTPLHRLRLPSGVRHVRFVNKKAGIDRTKRVRIDGGATVKLIEALD